MINKKTYQRVWIINQNGLTVYTAGAWPGWWDVTNTLIGFCIVAVVLAILLFMMYQVRRMLDGFSSYDWLNTILAFVFGGVFNLSLVLTFCFFLLWIPYFLLHQLSPKEFWIADECLYHRVRLAGLIHRTRRIQFNRITEIGLDKSGSKDKYVYHLKAVYEMRLPKWLFIVLVHWNERFTQWPLTLVNGIPTKDEAEALQIALLEPMTASPVCRIGD